MSEYDRERELLTRALHDQSRRVDGHGVGPEEVRHAARGIRRRRRIAAGAAVAVVLAIAVPFGLSLATGTGTAGPQFSSRVSTAPAPTVNRASPSPEPTRSPARPVRSKQAGTPVVAQIVDQAPQGAPPAIDYLQGSTLHRSDGSTTQLPASYDSFTPYHGGWLVSTFHNGDSSVLMLDGSLHQVSSQPGASRFAVSQDIFNPAWFVSGAPGQPGHLVTGIASGMGNGQPEQATPAGAQVVPIGWVSGSQVLYQTDSTHPEVRVTDFQGHDTRVADALAASGTSEGDGLAALQTSSSAAGSCWRVEKVATGHVLWHTCQFALGQFSQDGKYLWATDSYVDGAGDKLVVLFDAHTGQQVTAFKLRSAGYFGNRAWEDDTHLLVEVHGQDGWRLLRLGTDGSARLAAGPIPGSGTGTDSQGPWVFTARP